MSRLIISFPLLSIAILLVAVIAQLSFAQRRPSWGDCDPLSPSHCLAPFPNDFYAVASPSAATGRRVNVTQEQLANLDPTAMRINDRDGFGLGGPILFSFDAGTTLPRLDTASNAATWKNISLSLSWSRSPSLLIDVKSGELVPHWIEVDVRSGTSPLVEPATMLYPAKILDPARRYAVVIRNLRHKLTGQMITASPAFASLVAGTPLKDEPSLAERYPQFHDLFALLAQKGVKRDASLQLAWFFTTESDGSQLDRYRHLQSHALSKHLPAAGPNYFIDSVEDVSSKSADAHYYVFGKFEVPLYLNQSYPGTTGGSFVLDPTTRMPVYQRKANVTFEMIIPKGFVTTTSSSSSSSSLPASQQYGLLHVANGLFGNYTSSQRPYYEQVAREDRYVILAAIWWGLSREDLEFVAGAFLHDLNRMINVADMLHQSIVNQIFLTKVFMMSLGKRSDAIQPWFPPGKLDRERMHYSGNSLAGIMGLAFLAASPDINRGVVRVDGSPFGLLLPRSWCFDVLWLILEMRYKSAYQRMVVIYVIDMVLGGASAAGFMRHMYTDPLLPGNKPKVVGMQRGLSDAFVTSIAGEVDGRTMGARRFANSVHEPGEDVFGFGPDIHEPEITINASVGGAVWQPFDYGNPPIPLDDTPVPFRDNTHMCVSDDPRTIAFMRHFFKTGVFKNFCDAQRGCTRIANSTCPGKM